MSDNPLDYLEDELFSLKRIVEYAMLPDWSTEAFRLTHLHSVIHSPGNEQWDFVLETIDASFSYVISSSLGCVVVPLGKAAPSNGRHKHLRLLLGIPGLKRVWATQTIKNFPAPGQWFGQTNLVESPITKATFRYEGATVTLCLGDGSYFLVVERPAQAQTNHQNSDGTLLGQNGRNGVHPGVRL